MKKGQRTLFITLALVVIITLLIGKRAIACKASEVNNIPEISYEEECTFCDGDELTMKEKCEELIWKALTDEKNLLDDGIVTKELYLLQCEPFETALDKLETASDEEVRYYYEWILYYFYGHLSEYEADGEEIDKDFENYIMEEIMSLEDKYLL